jgi:hypothetical protein
MSETRATIAAALRTLRRNGRPALRLVEVDRMPGGPAPGELRVRGLHGFSYRKRAAVVVPRPCGNFVTDPAAGASITERFLVGAAGAITFVGLALVRIRMNKRAGRKT